MGYDMGMRPRHCLILMLLLVDVWGCDRESTPVGGAGGAEKKPAGVRVAVEVITPLPPGRLTHVAPDGMGQLFWVQETPDEGSTAAAAQVVFAMSDGGLPVATKVDAAAIAAALGRPGAAGAGGAGGGGEKSSGSGGLRGLRGQIQAMTMGADRRVYFYYVGETRREILAALGSFAPGTPGVKIHAEAARLKELSGMGDSLALARGSVVRSGNMIWLWLRHQDGHALLSLDVKRPGAALRKSFERVSHDGAELRLTSDQEDLSGGGGEGELLYLERGSATIWKIDPVGHATSAAKVADLPAGMTAPVLDDKGRLAAIAPMGPAFNEKDAAAAVSSGLTQPTTAPVPQYPALVLLEGDKRIVIGREAFDAPTSVNLADLRPSRLFVDRGSLVVYDGATGQLLRLRASQ